MFPCKTTSPSCLFQSYIIEHFSLKNLNHFISIELPLCGNGLRYQLSVFIANFSLPGNGMGTRNEIQYCCSFFNTLTTMHPRFRQKSQNLRGRRDLSFPDLGELQLNPRTEQMQKQVQKVHTQSKNGLCTNYSLSRAGGNF